MSQQPASIEQVLAKYIEEYNPHTHETRPIYGNNPKFEQSEPEEEIPLRIGGVDFAQRVDHTAFMALKIKDKALYQSDHYIWGHVNYGEILKDLIVIQDALLCQEVGYDNNNVGDMAIALMENTEIPFTPVKTTQQTKLEMIRILRTLFTKNMLFIEQAGELERQMFEQEQIVTNAGNLSYKHTGRHDDLFWALCYACYVAVPYLVGPTNYSIRSAPSYEPRDVDAEIDYMMGGADHIYPI